MCRWQWLTVLILFIGMLSGCSPLDRRPVGSSFVDESIENQAILQINNHHTGIVHVNVTCFNRRLLLTGEVPSAASKSEIETIAAGVPNVRAISNELVVGELRGIASRSADSLITSDVKLRFINYGAFRSSRVKTITEDGTVYLLGLVTHNEAASAADLASTTRGVKRVILLFDYLD